MPPAQSIESEIFQPRERVRVVVAGTANLGAADRNGKPLRPCVIVSRADRTLVKALLEAEVPSIASGEIGADTRTSADILGRLRMVGARVDSVSQCHFPSQRS